MKKIQRKFGGDWTQEKLERVRKYLVAYATIMNRQKFRYAYIDAFAGTGYRDLKLDEEKNIALFPEVFEKDSQEFLEGSARIALQVRPRFTKYIFIERDPVRFQELHKLRVDFPGLEKDIELINADANSYLQDICLNKIWKSNRAVLFLDPFGMQVKWETIEAIASTKAIDLWLLFPIGVAVNRLLKKDGKITPSWKQRLDKLFGTTEWYKAFYQPKRELGLFGDQEGSEKSIGFEEIGQFFVTRLKSVFAGVAENPLPLFNSRNIPLYMLCFASGNPRGASTAIKIAQDILKR